MWLIPVAEHKRVSESFVSSQHSKSPKFLISPPVQSLLENLSSPSKKKRPFLLAQLKSFCFNSVEANRRHSANTSGNEQEFVFLKTDDCKFTALRIFNSQKSTALLHVDTNNPTPWSTNKCLQIQTCVTCKLHSSNMLLPAPHFKHRNKLQDVTVSSESQGNNYKQMIYLPCRESN